MTDRWTKTQARYMLASPEDRAVIEHVMADVVDVVLSDNGGGLMFADPSGEGSMSVHILGDSSLAPLMVAAAPDIYERVFGVPDEVVLQ